jgi:hypothetical protein
MRCGRRELNSASLKIAMPEGLGLAPEKLEHMREILCMSVPLVDRGRRLATALLNFVCQEADANAITLILTAKKFGDTLGPDEARLVLWYEKFGFTVLQQTPGGMIMARQVRPPGAKPVVRPLANVVAGIAKRLLH